MRRKDYYRPNDDNSREDYQRRSYQQQPDQGPSYTNYNNYGPAQQPYYPPRRHHHVFMWIVVIVLCLGLGWFAADHFLGGNQSSQPQTTVNRSATTNNKTTNDPTKTRVIQDKQPDAMKVENEMNRLDVSQQDQLNAEKFFMKQSAQNQQKILKTIGLINRVIPSNTLKKQALKMALKNFEQ